MGPNFDEKCHSIKQSFYEGLPHVVALIIAYQLLQYQYAFLLLAIIRNEGNKKILQKAQEKKLRLVEIKRSEEKDPFTYSLIQKSPFNRTFFNLPANPNNNDVDVLILKPPTDFKISLKSLKRFKSATFNLTNETYQLLNPSVYSPPSNNFNNFNFTPSEQDENTSVQDENINVPVNPFRRPAMAAIHNPAIKLKIGRPNVPRLSNSEQFFSYINITSNSYYKQTKTALSKSFACSCVLWWLDYSFLKETAKFIHLKICQFVRWFAFFLEDEFSESFTLKESFYVQLGDSKRVVPLFRLLENINYEKVKQNWITIRIINVLYWLVMGLRKWNTLVNDSGVALTMALYLAYNLPRFLYAMDVETYVYLGSIVWDYVFLCIIIIGNQLDVRLPYKQFNKLVKSVIYGKGTLPWLMELWLFVIKRLYGVVKRVMIISPTGVFLSIYSYWFSSIFLFIGGINYTYTIYKIEISTAILGEAEGLTIEFVDSLIAIVCLTYFFYFFVVKFVLRKLHSFFQEPVQEVFNTLMWFLNSSLVRDQKVEQTKKVDEENEYAEQTQNRFLKEFNKLGKFVTKQVNKIVVLLSSSTLQKYFFFYWTEFVQTWFTSLIKFLSRRLSSFLQLKEYFVKHFVFNWEEFVQTWLLPLLRRCIIVFFILETPEISQIYKEKKSYL